ncbi:MAG: hypothetical protein U5L72_06445 [Bacteroidales bacterium]|nr:hypothetical protein [Bacteroidales bacterium]
MTYGKDLGTSYIAGLAVDAMWNRAEMLTTDQNGLWQVGARIYKY